VRNRAPADYFGDASAYRPESGAVIERKVKTSTAESPTMEIIDGTKTECSRCEEVVHLSEAVVLERRNNKAMEKPLCEECLEAVGVPKGYELERDVSYLER
jgi:hypothetical protein